MTTALLGCKSRSIADAESIPQATLSSLRRGRRNTQLAAWSTRERERLQLFSCPRPRGTPSSCQSGSRVSQRRTFLVPLSPCSTWTTSVIYYQCATSYLAGVKRPMRRAFQPQKQIASPVHCQVLTLLCPGKPSRTIRTTTGFLTSQRCELTGRGRFSAGQRRAALLKARLG